MAKTIAAQDAKHLRVIEANRVITAISMHGRRFFYTGPGVNPSRAKASPDGRIARFEKDARGALWFRDDYTWKPIYVAWDRGQWKGWSHGGTLRDLVRALRDYIRTGTPIRPGWFGPWPDWVCEGDLWGYGAEAMAAVREAVMKTEAVAKPNPTSLRNHAGDAT
jgi:hypothetical protein